MTNKNKIKIPIDNSTEEFVCLECNCENCENQENSPNSECEHCSNLIEHKEEVE